MTRSSAFSATNLAAPAPADRRRRRCGAVRPDRLAYYVWQLPPACPCPPGAATHSWPASAVECWSRLGRQDRDSCRILKILASRQVSLLQQSSAPATQRGEGPEARVYSVHIAPVQQYHQGSSAWCQGCQVLTASGWGTGVVAASGSSVNQSRDAGVRGVRGAVCASRAVRRRQGYRVERGARSAWQQQPSRRWRRRGRARAPHRCKQNALLLEPAGARDPGRHRRCCAGAADAQNRRRGTSACVPHCLFSPAIPSHKH